MGADVKVSGTISIEEGKIVVMKEAFEEATTSVGRGVAPKSVAAIKISYKEERGL